MGRTTNLDGKPQDLIGEAVTAGTKAPDFTIQQVDLRDCSLGTFAGKTRIFCALPSLYTGVCDRETRRFNEEASGLVDTVVVVVSMDLPFSQRSWCGAHGIENVLVASDHRNASFGRAYGCLVSGGPFDRCLSRAVFVVGPDDKLRYVEYVPDIGQEPNYDAALTAARG